MANREHLGILKQGAKVWNEWRVQYPQVRPDLSHASCRGFMLHEVNLSNTDLSRADLSRVGLYRANLSEANLSKADLSNTDLSGANLSEVDLSNASLRAADVPNVNLRNANLTNANLHLTNFGDSDLSGADLSGANLSYARLVGTNLTKAKLINCRIYGIAAWDVQLEKTIQSDLTITKEKEPSISVDNLEVAQFIYLLLNNAEIRNVIDSITSKVVLILGRFTPERKVVLDAIRDELRRRNYTPVLFDFEKPASRDITETVSILAHLARFVIADITEPKSIPQELSHIVPFLPSVPIVPLLQASEREYGMYEHFISYPWVQANYHYRNLDELLHSMQEHIIDPAEKKVRELAIEKARRLERP